jgi:hypothetical protein
MAYTKVSQLDELAITAVTTTANKLLVTDGQVSKQLPALNILNANTGTLELKGDQTTTLTSDANGLSVNKPINGHQSGKQFGLKGDGTWNRVCKIHHRNVYEVTVSTGGSEFTPGSLTFHVQTGYNDDEHIDATCISAIGGVYATNVRFTAHETPNELHSGLGFLEIQCSGAATPYISVNVRGLGADSFFELPATPYGYNMPEMAFTSNICALNLSKFSDLDVAGKIDGLMLIGKENNYYNSAFADMDFNPSSAGWTLVLPGAQGSMNVVDGETKGLNSPYLSEAEWNVQDKTNDKRLANTNTPFHGGIQHTSFNGVDGWLDGRKSNSGMTAGWNRCYGNILEVTAGTSSLPGGLQSIHAGGHKRPNILFHESMENIITVQSCFVFIETGHLLLGSHAGYWNINVTLQNSYRTPDDWINDGEWHYVEYVSNDADFRGANYLIDHFGFDYTEETKLWIAAPQLRYYKKTGIYSDHTLPRYLTREGE